MSDFYRTNMGMKFFEGTMPSLVTELRRLNDLLERLVKVAEKAEADDERNSRG